MSANPAATLSPPNLQGGPIYGIFVHTPYKNAGPTPSFYQVTFSQPGAGSAQTDAGLPDNSTTLAPVPGVTIVMQFWLMTPGYNIVGVNIQKQPYGTDTQPTWVIVKDTSDVKGPPGLSGALLIYVQMGSTETRLGVQIILEDTSNGNIFCSQDPEIVNPGKG